MGSPTAPLDLALTDPEQLKSRSLRFQSLISRNGANSAKLLGPITYFEVMGPKSNSMLLLTINRKKYMAGPMTPCHHEFELERP